MSADNDVRMETAQMIIPLRRIGNSLGVILPAPLLRQAGLEGEVDLVVEDCALVLRRPASPPREGWAEASQRIAASGDDALVMPEFGNDGDAELCW